MAYTIAIAGTSGAGKSSVARAVAGLLDAALLHFDDYEQPDAPAVVADFEGWIASGLPAVAHGETTLAGEVAKLRSGEPIQRPGGGGVIAPTPYIVIEEPTGRARAAIAPLIDLAVVIATPPNIALARRIRRDLAPYTEERLAQVQSYLDWYAAGGHAFYDRLLGLSTAGADLVVDGTLPIDEIAPAVVNRATASG